MNAVSLRLMSLRLSTILTATVNIFARSSRRGFSAREKINL